MILTLALGTALAANPDEQCQRIGLSDVIAVDPPAVIVLGERHGVQPDLTRAAKIVRTFALEGPVTVAIEAVALENQPILDAYAAGDILPEDMPAKLNWESTWGFPWDAYSKLVLSADVGAKVVAAGPPLGLPDDPGTVPIPPGYLQLLMGAMQGHEVPPGGQDRFVKAMSWRDKAISDVALDAWSGEGWLIIVTGRGHVEGGKGVAWQADHRTDAPVESFVLAWGGSPLCTSVDKVWRPGPFG